MTFVAGCEVPTPRFWNACAERQECLTEGRCQPRSPEAAAELEEPDGDNSPKWMKTKGRVKPTKKAPDLKVKTMGRPGRGEAARYVVEEVTDCNINGRRCESDSRREAARDESASDSLCVATKDADCRRSVWACRIDGRCTAEDGRCVVGSDADCEQSYRCRRNGWCTEDDGRCVAGSDGDCADSEVCAVFGHCEAIDGACTLSADKRRELVRNVLDEGSTTFLRGRMGVRANPFGGPTGYSYVGRRIDAASKKQPTPQRMPATAELEPSGAVESCSDLDICEYYGRCSTSEGACVAEDDADCESAKICEWLGACRAEDGECVEGESADRDRFDSVTVGDGPESDRRSCEDHQLCNLWGRCSREKGRCAVAADEDCRRSGMCELFGWCKDYGEDFCDFTKEKREFLMMAYEDRSRFQRSEYRHERRKRMEAETLFDGMTEIEQMFMCREVYSSLPADEACENKYP